MNTSNGCFRMIWFCKENKKKSEKEAKNTDNKLSYFKSNVNISDNSISMKGKFQTKHLLVVKSTANISADSEQILEHNIEVNKSPVELEFQINRFIQKTHMCFLKGCLGSKIDFAYGLTMMK